MATRKAVVYVFYVETTDADKTACRATCKNCKKGFQRTVERLKAHHDICNKQQEMIARK